MVAKQPSFTFKDIEQAKANQDLVRLIGQRIPLTREGHEWRGLCPFHIEKTPSFSVVPQKGFYHCFGCGAHGDVVIFEDMIGSGGTACDLAALLKTMGARSVSLFATSGLFTTDAKKGEPLSASVERINQSQLDAVYITDTLTHRLTDPKIDRAIRRSPKVHVIKTAPYLAAIIRALHTEIGEETTSEQNSVSAILRGTHPDQVRDDQKIAVPVLRKSGSPLLTLVR
jgi:predicted nucleic acid-binding Zn ribbon protein